LSQVVKEQATPVEWKLPSCPQIWAIFPDPQYCYPASVVVNYVPAAFVPPVHELALHVPLYYTQLPVELQYSSYPIESQISKPLGKLFIANPFMSSPLLQYTDEHGAFVFSQPLAAHVHITRSDPQTYCPNNVAGIGIPFD